MTRIDLIWLTRNSIPPQWTAGTVYPVAPTPAAVRQAILENLPHSNADAWLFWDETLGSPCPDDLFPLLAGPADGWHAGLRMGMGARPAMIDFVSPTWMLNRDPDSHIEATSWRLSLGCFLIRAQVLRQMGAPLAEFSSLDMASLELGLRYIRNGVILRHCPDLTTQVANVPIFSDTLADQLWFLTVSYGRKWAKWAGMRMVLSGAARAGEVWKAWKLTQSFHLPEQVTPYTRPSPPLEETRIDDERVSVLIPTINRYPYLRTLLAQLREQTVKPWEILVIDQTPQKDRDITLPQTYTDLPVRWFYLDRAGQCSSRNMGLNHSTGNLVLFIDDDDEIAPDLIERHIDHMRQFGSRVSNGVTHEDGAGPLPEKFTYQRVSDVFPANNSMIRKAVLHRSGLFDPAYDHGQRADGDLGMRIYLTGELMILNPQVSLIHHHAPVGGLREHKARVHTYAASRQRLTVREIASVSDIYLAKRYFTGRQVREMLWMNAFGTLSIRGTLHRKLAKAMIGLVTMPYTLYLYRQRFKQAEALMRAFKGCPQLEQDR